ncbi:hypothetical protein A9Q83_14255 [Alphaproteobacteria bacterium 46_93_T64]|nr:hypothetical protein A9Q83_14255 [Alphaproteobacteria bacterium 46_93_T64]
MTLQVYTASLLKEGLVAYLCIDTEGSYWSTDLNKAATAETDQAETLKSLAEQAERENIVIAAYAVDVELTENGTRPLENRERIRAYGPTITLPQSSDTKQAIVRAA